MKFIHLADLHIGKRVNAFPMLEDQRYILREILSILREEQPDGGVILAGDIYDKPVPAADAVELFDDFLYQLSLLKLRVFIIAGNHDSPERIAFGNRLMDRSGIYLSPVYDGQVRCISCEEPGQSPVDVYLLPFLKPSHVRRFYPEEEIESYTDALHTAIRHMAPDPSHRNLLVTHQFVTGSARSDSKFPWAARTMFPPRCLRRLTMWRSAISTGRRWCTFLRQRTMQTTGSCGRRIRGCALAGMR